MRAVTFKLQISPNPKPKGKRGAILGCKSNIRANIYVTPCRLIESLTDDELISDGEKLIISVDLVELLHLSPNI